MAARGSAHHRTRLTEADVLAIRRRRMDGETERSIAATYGLSASAMHEIVTGESWRHVGFPKPKPQPKPKAAKADPKPKPGAVETVWSGAMRVCLTDSALGSSLGGGPKRLGL